MSPKSPTGVVKPRKRQFAPKARTGCKTCKARKVKCGEEKPYCYKCTSSGRLCEGYETIRVAQTKTNALGAIALRWVEPPSQIPEITTQEQESLYYFRDVLLDSSCASWDTDLWQRLILPMSVNEPVVRHAVVALGALSRPGFDHHAFGLQQYGAAMQCLSTQISPDVKPPHHLILVTCLLFVAIEYVQEGWEQGQFHLNGGLSIVKESQAKNAQSGRGSPSKSSDIMALEDLFSRLDNQQSLFTSTRVQLNRAMDNGRMSFLPAELRLKSVGDAVKAQTLHIAAMRELVCEVESQRFSPAGITPGNYVELELQQSRQLISLERWHTAMLDFIERIKDPGEMRLAKLLLPPFYCCKMMVSNALSDGREEYHDRFMPEFERILSLADELLPTGVSLKRFSLDTGILGPLYWIVLKCRDPGMRRKAIAYLRSFNLQEGVWEGSRLAAHGEQTMKVEELGLNNPQTAADIPERSRLWRAYYDVQTGDNVLYCMRRAFEGDEYFFPQTSSQTPYSTLDRPRVPTPSIAVYAHPTTRAARKTDGSRVMSVTDNGSPRHCVTGLVHAIPSTLSKGKDMISGRTAVNKGLLTLSVYTFGQRTL